MSNTIYWNLLVLFGVLCQGIIGTLSDMDIDESSELLIRQKRVINLLPGGDRKEPIRRFPYIVAIKLLRVDNFCAGVILTTHIVLTVAKCVVSPVESYRVYSGCAQVSRRAHPHVHSITKKRINIGHDMFRPTDGIALITVNPAFRYTIFTNNIGLYEGPVQPGVYGTVAGWGCNPNSEEPGTKHPDRLRSITVPVISNHDCAMLYLRNFPISDSDICTLDATDNQYCGVNDVGAPLVVDVSGETKLVGIHLWNGAVVGRSNNPDVFVRLQHPIYKTWIAETIRSLEEHLNYPNQIHYSRDNPHVQQTPHHLDNILH